MLQTPQQHLLEHGRPGQATILAARRCDTAGPPLLELDLEVRVDGLPAYRVTHRQVVALLAVPSFRPGAGVPVRVDPYDPRSLIVA